MQRKLYKRLLHIYGRYVDDFVLIHSDKSFLLSAKEKIKNYLQENCRLTLHPKKMYLQHYTKGVAFLGAYIKPHRIYIGKRTRGNFFKMIRSLKTVRNVEELKLMRATLNSYLGLMQHFKTYRLRAVDFKYDLRRVGMVQDTITTTVPDTTYARGVEFLNKRKYSEALEILDTYKDQNTAIVLLSLGYDKTALEILGTLPSTAVVEYLKAIACARLGQKEKALEYFREACLLDDKMEYRGNLDPEISELIK